MKSLRSKAGKAALHIGSSVNYTPHLGPTDSPGTHDARLNGDVEGADIQVFPVEGIGGCGDGLHFCVGRHVVQGFGQIVCPRNNAIATHNNCTYGNFVFVKSDTCLFEGALHVIFISHNKETGEKEM